MQVAAQRSAAQHAAARDLELSADVLARCGARLAVRDQGSARLKDQRLDLARWTADRRGDLRVAQVTELEEHECLALVVGQAREVGHQLSQIRSAPDVLGEAIEADSISSTGRRRRDACRRTVRQRLRAIANSQGRTASGSRPVRSAR